MAYDGLGDATEVMRLEGELRKYKKFVGHIYNHSDGTQHMEDWVMCKICGKTFAEIVEGMRYAKCSICQLRTTEKEWGTQTTIDNTNIVTCKSCFKKELER